MHYHKIELMNYQSKGERIFFVHGNLYLFNKLAFSVTELAYLRGKLSSKYMAKQMWPDTPGYREM